MSLKANLAWKCFRKTGKTDRYINVECMFCSKSYLSGKADRMLEHLDKECKKLTPEARAALDVLIKTVNANEPPSTDDDDNDEDDDDGDQSSSSEGSEDSDNEIQIQEVGGIDYCTPAFPDLEKELNEEELVGEPTVGESPSRVETPARSTKTSTEIPPDDGLGYVMENDPEMVWWDALEKSAEEDEMNGITAGSSEDKANETFVGESGDGEPEETSVEEVLSKRPSTDPAEDVAPPAASGGGVQGFVSPLSRNRWEQRSSRSKLWESAIEDQKYQEYLANHSCQKDCPNKISKEQLLARRKLIREMTFDVRQAFYMGLMFSVLSQDPRRVKASYCFAADVKTCRRTFLYANDMGKDTMYSRRADIFGGKISLIRHGNVGKKGSRAIKAVQVRAVLRYLMEQGSLYGLPVPTAARGSTRLPYVLFPPRYTRFELWDISTRYSQAVKMKSSDEPSTTSGESTRLTSNSEVPHRHV
ncbi:hypothetical protein RvY_04725 [Ramazzottius varieornatus]|uniref:BED-type domain-containing protein n=1 Tax=Ramazzottius varieornatus TaxID=947166 RepID=A0A1D1USM8_RAMVA|nr:hypothetical protein RvY_04725 [Ramazzottius varieornatus]